MTRRIVTWSLSGLLIGAILGLCEGVVLVTRARAMFFHGTELALTVLWAVSIVTAVGTLGFTVIGLVAQALAPIARRTNLHTRPFLLSSITAAIIFSPLVVALWQLTAGPQASQLPGRPILVALTAFLFATAIAAALVGIPLWANRSPARKLAIAILALLISIGLYAVDQTVLLRLYPVFHFGLSVAAFTAGGLGIRLWLAPPNTSVGFGVRIGIVCCATALGCWSFYTVRGTQNPRFVISEKTAAVSKILALSYLASPLDDPLNVTAPSGAVDVFPASSDAAITRPKADLFLITVDAMRFDRLTLLGSRRSVAPNMDQLAERSVVFANAYTPIPHTSYAISSLLTGKYTRPLFDVPGAPAVHETWPEILSRFRYKTAAFFTKAVFFIDRPRFEPYLRSSYGFSYRKVDYLVGADERVEQVLTYLREKRADGISQPLFVWTHFFDPHEPYDANCTQFGDRAVDRYDCEIHAVDRAVGKLMGYIDHNHPGSIVILTSDHGEEFEEHGGRFHGTTLYDEQVRVPLLINIPDIPHRVVREPVNLVDLLGTALTILDIPVPARVRSIDLTGLMVGQDAERKTFSEAHEKTMIAKGDHKLICDRVSSLCQLYNLVTDPGEKRSITALEPKLASALRAELGSWKKSHARYELRPIRTQTGMAKWPAAIQKALGGDEENSPQLFSLLEGHREPLVRRKAAELIYQLAKRPPPMDPLQALHQETDPEVRAWLYLLHLKTGGSDAAESLAAVNSELKPLSDVWRRVALARLAAGDGRAFDSVHRIVMEEISPTEDRQQAIRLVGNHGNPTVVPDLISLINNYQLTLEIAAALGKIGDRRAVRPLIKRLKRERFIERKTVIIQALAVIGDKRAVRPIAGEFALQEPPSGILPALAAMGRTPIGGRVFSLSDSPRKAAVYRGFTGTMPVTKLTRISRITVHASARADGGRVIVSCNGRESAHIPLFAGERETQIDVADCSGDKNSPPSIGFAIAPEGLEATIHSVAFIGG